MSKIQDIIKTLSEVKIEEIIRCKKIFGHFYDGEKEYSSLMICEHTSNETNIVHDIKQGNSVDIHGAKISFAYNKFKCDGPIHHKKIHFTGLGESYHLALVDLFNQLYLADTRPVIKLDNEINKLITN